MNNRSGFIYSICKVIPKTAMALVFVIIFPVIYLANSAPYRNIAPTPQSAAFILDTDCPVIVNREDLLFNFDGKTSVMPNTYLGSLATASYDMVNPTDGDLRVNMAFPFISSINDVLSFSKIKTDGAEVPFQLIDVGEALNQVGSGINKQEDILPDMDNILKAISENDNYVHGVPKSGVIYTLKAVAKVKTKKYFACKIIDESKDGIILIKPNNNTVKLSKNTYRIIDSDIEVEIFVSNKGARLEFGMWDSENPGIFENSTTDFNFYVEEYETDLKSFLQKDLYENVISVLSPQFTDTKFDAYITFLQKMLNNNDREWIIQTYSFSQMRILVFLYTIADPMLNKISGVQRFLVIT